ncbi:hypothetical protein B9Z19DRAFT_237667 [Tuber borchii]|uniref:Uncharacterized protein n=1 Tax=Tuber borchii TaxID=42251 RepID=A0A2T7A5P5_TUBBO|nr:hypothetical protein B9Z19DRAFT_237667 [Tuber borchii]
MECGVNGGKAAPLPSALCPQLLRSRACWLVPLAKRLAEKKCTCELEIREGNATRPELGLLVPAAMELELESLRTPPPLLTTLTRRTHRGLSQLLCCFLPTRTPNTRMGECTGIVLVGRIPYWYGSRRTKPPTKFVGCGGLFAHSPVHFQFQCLGSDCLREEDTVCKRANGKTMTV